LKGCQACVWHPFFFIGNFEIRSSAAEMYPVISFFDLSYSQNNRLKKFYIGRFRINNQLVIMHIGKASAEICFIKIIINYGKRFLGLSR
jgi:hypothetical protein